MDDRRFDQLTRMVGRGASRRSILKGLLGLGGAAITSTVAGEEVDARAQGTRPTIPPPPPPTTTTTTTTAAPCPDEEQCPNSTLCCPVDTCARSGNQAICCDGTLGNGSVVCGLDCCDTDDQCCDGECCPDETVCLARVFDEGPFVEEETCCPFLLTCDNRCCEGECFDPGMTVNDSVLPLQLDQFDQTCCPAEGTVCPGANGTFCCRGDTPQCCIRDNGDAVCLAADACCTDDDCNAEDDPANCLEGVCNTETGICEPQTVCGVLQTCCIGGDDVCCPEDRVCCGPACCGVGEECCERTVDGVLIQTCIDPQTQCCTNPDCLAPPFNFDQGCVACPPTGLNANTCVPRNEGDGCGAGECNTCYQGQCLGCDTNEICCVNAPFPVCIDLSQPDVCCTSDQCPDSPETCEEGVCTATDCSLQPTCDPDQICCPDTAGSFGCIADTTCPTTTTTTTTVAPTTTTLLPTTTTTAEPNCLGNEAFCTPDQVPCCGDLRCNPVGGTTGGLFRCGLCLVAGFECEVDSCCDGFTCEFDAMEQQFFCEPAPTTTTATPTTASPTTTTQAPTTTTATCLPQFTPVDCPGTLGVVHSNASCCTGICLAHPLGGSCVVAQCASDDQCELEDCTEPIREDEICGCSGDGTCRRIGQGCGLDEDCVGLRLGGGPPCTLDTCFCEFFCQRDPDFCLWLQEICDPSDNRCCQFRGTTNCEDVPGGGPDPQCCLLPGAICGDFRECCGLQDCRNNRCCGFATVETGTCSTQEECCDGLDCQNERCCQPLGHSCFNPLHCCDGLTCDHESSFTCVPAAATTAAPATTTTQAPTTTTQAPTTTTQAPTTSTQAPTTTTQAPATTTTTQAPTTTTASCDPGGFECTVDAECCSGNCLADIGANICCLDGGQGCAGADFFCCSGSCNDVTEQCDPVGIASTAGAPDCSPRDFCNDGECGAVDDECGGTIDCGECPCIPTTTCAGQCGLITDDCGGTLDCGACPTTPAPLTCFAEGERCVNDEQCCAGLCRGRNCLNRGTKICQAACTA